MARVPWWGLVSSAAAPVLLVGGWTLAASRQAAGFSSVTGTISALAAHGATDRWIMTGALVCVGFCHCVTAAALGRVAGRQGLVVLAVGGVCTVGVAAFPLPVSGGSAAHTTVAVLAFGALATWPFLTARREAPLVLRPGVSVPAGLLLSALVGWFAIELKGGHRVGLAERAAAGAQALWPLAVVAAVRLGSEKVSGGR